MFIAANPAIGMLSLSDQFAAATSEAQRSIAVVPGQALLAGWEGTAFQVGYVGGQVAGIIMGLAMLRSDRFGRAIPYTLILGNLVGFGLYLPAIGPAASAFSGWSCGPGTAWSRDGSSSWQALPSPWPTDDLLWRR